jgi:hypothetical protein
LAKLCSSLVISYPFTPKSNARLEPGQFWSIPLSRRRFACERVLAVGSGTTSGGRSRFLAGLLDWVGAGPASVDSIAARSSSKPTDELLRPAATGEGVIQFSRLVSESDFRRLAEGLGSLRKNDRARALLWLPSVTRPFDWRADER